ncbi:hypothetical protein DEO72_LG3g1615 [Vigna unguiculata]|uniref:Uncharacterized protein n=1 Tax=Vigna unguiculata TaxID=3917 RepID=A0A4D6LFW5_VIGUN|nr:hypothetical protein DEO72_LG3g1615 [Vigna unguiculata]
MEANLRKEIVAIKEPRLTTMCGDNGGKSGALERRMRAPMEASLTTQWLSRRHEQKHMVIGRNWNFDDDDGDEQHLQQWV